MKYLFTLLSIFIGTYRLLPLENLKLNISQLLVLGEESILFESITAVCEDPEKNIYILDGKAFKVYKFSKDGKILLTFGNKGKGPGDFSEPGSIFITPEGNPVVNEDRFYISLFNSNGTFLERLYFPEGLSLTYINKNIFYCSMRGEKHRNHQLIERKGTLIKSFFNTDLKMNSISLPDQEGRLVMFNFFKKGYTPFFILTQTKSYFAIGISNNYKIQIYSSEGILKSIVTKNIKPEKISTAEKLYYTKEISDFTKYPEKARKMLVKKIPDFKNQFNQLLLSGNVLWVFRIKKDITNEKSPILTDLYSLDGKSMGSLYIKQIPLLITDEYMYIVESNEKDDLLLIKYSYKIEPL